MVEIIGRHDIGWAEADLAGLESADRVPPISFLAYPVPGAVDAWRRSIRAAERRSPLAGILTSRHFCLLASPDDPLHVGFKDEESKRRELNEGACSVPGPDLDRFERALGFCDLLSLCLCSGSREAVRLSLSHPADPSSADAVQVAVSVSGETVRCDPAVFEARTEVHVNSWKRGGDGRLVSERIGWTFA